MSWLFSQALVEEYLVDTYLDGEQSAPLNGNHTQQAYLSLDRMTAYSRISRFGMMFKPLMECRGEELLISYLAGFRAKTFLAQDAEKESRESEAVCGRTWQESLAKYDQDSCSWKTPQCSLLEDSIKSSVTWPRWGSMRNGVCYRQQPVVRLTKETESGFWPTPTAHNAKEGAFPAEYTRNTPTLAAKVGGKLNPMWVEWLMGWPLGWTDLKPLETDKYQLWQQQHSNF